MPKFPKAFARRKSTANVFEDLPEQPAEGGTFKVFERGVSPGKSFDGGVKFAKAGATHASRPRTAQLESDNIFENLGKNR